MLMMGAGNDGAASNSQAEGPRAERAPNKPRSVAARIDSVVVGQDFRRVVEAALPPYNLRQTGLPQYCSRHLALVLMHHAKFVNFCEPVSQLRRHIRRQILMARL